MRYPQLKTISSVIFIAVLLVRVESDASATQKRVEKVVHESLTFADPKPIQAPDNKASSGQAKQEKPNRIREDSIDDNLTLDDGSDEPTTRLPKKLIFDKKPSRQKQENQDEPVDTHSPDNLSRVEHTGSQPGSLLRSFVNHKDSMTPPDDKKLKSDALKQLQQPQHQSPHKSSQKPTGPQQQHPVFDRTKSKQSQPIIARTEEAHYQQQKPLVKQPMQSDPIQHHHHQYQQQQRQQQQQMLGQPATRPSESQQKPELTTQPPQVKIIPQPLPGVNRTIIQMGQRKDQIDELALDKGTETDSSAVKQQQVDLIDRVRTHHRESNANQTVLEPTAMKQTRLKRNLESRRTKTEKPARLNSEEKKYQLVDDTAELGYASLEDEEHPLYGLSARFDPNPDESLDDILQSRQDNSESEEEQEHKLVPPGQHSAFQQQTASVQQQPTTPKPELELQKQSTSQTQHQGQPEQPQQPPQSPQQEPQQSTEQPSQQQPSTPRHQQHVQPPSPQQPEPTKLSEQPASSQSIHQSSPQQPDSLQQRVESTHPSEPTQPPQHETAATTTPMPEQPKQQDQSRQSDHPEQSDTPKLLDPTQPPQHETAATSIPTPEQPKQQDQSRQFDHPEQSDTPKLLDPTQPPQHETAAISTPMPEQPKQQDQSRRSHHLEQSDSSKLPEYTQPPEQPEQSSEPPPRQQQSEPQRQQTQELQSEPQQQTDIHQDMDLSPSILNRFLESFNMFNLLSCMVCVTILFSVNGVSRMSRDYSGQKEDMDIKKSKHSKTNLKEEQLKEAKQALLEKLKKQEELAPLRSSIQRIKQERGPNINLRTNKLRQWKLEIEKNKELKSRDRSIRYDKLISIRDLVNLDDLFNIIKWNDLRLQADELQKSTFKARVDSTFLKKQTELHKKIALKFSEDYNDLLKVIVQEETRNSELINQLANINISRCQSPSGTTTTTPEQTEEMLVDSIY